MCEVLPYDPHSCDLLTLDRDQWAAVNWADKPAQDYGRNSTEYYAKFNECRQNAECSAGTLVKYINMNKEVSSRIILMMEG